MSHKEATAVPKRFSNQYSVKIARTSDLTSGESSLSGTLSATWKHSNQNSLRGRMGKREKEEAEKPRKLLPKWAIVPKWMGTVS
jgi:hypothetical protein